ncbi:unnamed protein product [Amoebophrya sp. A120]|nr:unnamed protein product [Amoebophrya sp. A120]|eukprot:GSA120T00014988001.1
MPEFFDPLSDLVKRHQADDSGERFEPAENGDGCPYREDDIMSAEKGVSTGTTIMAVEFDGGVVMAADSRTSMGDYVANRVSRKITPVHDRIFVCRSGSAADTQALTGYVQHYLGLHSMELKDPKFPKVNTCATLFQQLVYNNKDHLMAGLIVAGYDKVHGGQVYVIPLGGAKFRRGYAVGGSGSAYIMGLIDAEYKPGMTEEEARAKCKKWVSHAMTRDGSSGGVVRTMVIKESGTHEDYTYGDGLPSQPL